MGKLIAQGQCETTQTPRFQIPDCACGTYEGNLGPCLTWWQGGSGHCVYCGARARVPREAQQDAGADVDD